MVAMTMKFYLLLYRKLLKNFKISDDLNLPCTKIGKVKELQCYNRRDRLGFFRGKGFKLLNTDKYIANVDFNFYKSPCSFLCIGFWKWFGSKGSWHLWDLFALGLWLFICHLSLSLKIFIIFFSFLAVLFL